MMKVYHRRYPDAICIQDLVAYPFFFRYLTPKEAEGDSCPFFIKVTVSPLRVTVPVLPSTFLSPSSRVTMAGSVPAGAASPARYTGWKPGRP